MKKADGPDLLVMGSGSIVAQLAAAGLVDEFQLVVVPVVVGAGRTLFDGVSGPMAMDLVRSESFSNGNVVYINRYNVGRIFSLGVSATF